MICLVADRSKWRRLSVVSDYRFSRRPADWSRRSTRACVHHIGITTERLCLLRSRRDVSDPSICLLPGHAHRRSRSRTVVQHESCRLSASCLRGSSYNVGCLQAGLNEQGGPCLHTCNPYTPLEDHDHPGPFARCPRGPEQMWRNVWCQRFHNCGPGHFPQCCAQSREVRSCPNESADAGNCRQAHSLIAH
jgi:hypothetical protein